MAGKTNIRIWFEERLGFWTFGIVLATFALGGVAWHQLGEISKSTSADFMLRFRNNFYSSDTRRLEILIDKKLIKYVNDTANVEYFQIDSVKLMKNKPVLEKEHIDSIEGYKIDAYKMDDELLSHFDEMGYLEKTGVLSTDLIYEFFYWDIEVCWENTEINKYIETVRKSLGAYNYSNFEYLYKKCKDIDKEKNALQKK
jgi:hypothetical protein